MKILVAAPLGGVFAKQEEVEVEKIIFYKEFLLVLHRPVKSSRDHHCVWVVSDAASGIGISRSISEKLAIKMAVKRMKLHKRYFLDGRKKMLEKIVFVN